MKIKYPRSQLTSPRESKAMTNREKRKEKHNKYLENAMNRRMNELQNSLFSGAKSEFRKATARLNSQQPGEETVESADPLTAIFPVSEDRPQNFGDPRAFLCQASIPSSVIVIQ